MEEEQSERYEKSDIIKLSIFDGNNFSNWKFRTDILMRDYVIESFLTKSANEYVEILVLETDTAAIQRENNKKKEEKGTTLRDPETLSNLCDLE